MIAETELKEIVAKHEEWLRGGKCGEPATLRGANLRGANLCGANLCNASLCNSNLCGANLRGVDLRGADLRGADLREANPYEANLLRANLYGANLYNTNLRYANLRYANLHSAVLHGANLYGADLYSANLYGADLCDANLRNAKNVPFIPMTCPDSGSFTAWKKAGSFIVKLLIPDDARRSSATGRKCRCDKAVVIAIETMSGEPTDLCMVRSDYYSGFVYKVGETVTEPAFCEDRFKECAPGIHFFINRQEAVDYD